MLRVTPESPIILDRLIVPILVILTSLKSRTNQIRIALRSNDARRIYLNNS